MQGAGYPRKRAVKPFSVCFLSPTRAINLIVLCREESLETIEVALSEFRSYQFEQVDLDLAMPILAKRFGIDFMLKALDVCSFDATPDLRSFLSERFYLIWAAVPSKNIWEWYQENFYMLPFSCSKTRSFIGEHLVSEDLGFFPSELFPSNEELQLFIHEHFSSRYDWLLLRSPYSLVVGEKLIHYNVQSTFSPKDLRLFFEMPAERKIEVYDRLLLRISQTRGKSRYLCDRLVVRLLHTMNEDLNTVLPALLEDMLLLRPLENFTLFTQFSKIEKYREATISFFLDRQDKIIYKCERSTMPGLLSFVLTLLRSN